jgi:DNA-directed RNA polymerase alpha subunit
MNARERLAHDLRGGGKTYAEIGHALGVSAHRASQICKKAEWLLGREAIRAEFAESDLRGLPDCMSLLDALRDEHVKAFLSIRTCNCLYSEASAAFGNIVKTIGDVRRAKDEDLLRIPNFGRKSLHEVRSVLG